MPPDGDEVELEVDDEGLLWLHFDVVPPAAAPAPAIELVALGRLHAQMARIPTTGAPIRLGGARPPVHWPSRLPDQDIKKSPEPSRRDAQSQPKAPPGKLGAEQYELEALMAAESKATADARLRWHHANYRNAHGTFNHRSSAVGAAIAAGVFKDAAHPPGFPCLACAHVDPSDAHIARNQKVGSSVSLIPYHHFELGLWGPFEVGDPNGFRYLFGGVDRATGKVSSQPIRTKSEAKEAPRAHLALIRAQ